jgi:hypothetical protein
LKETNRKIPNVYRICFVAIVAFWLFAPGERPAKAKEKKAPAAKQETITEEHSMALNPKTTEFLIRSGEGAGEKVSMWMKRTGDSSDLWTLTFENFYRLFIHRTSRGAVRIARIEILDRQKAISFDPSIDLFPSRIAEGLGIETSGRTDVFSLKSGKNINKGTFTHLVKDFGRAKFVTPAGEIDGYLIRQESRLDLDYATLRIQLEAGLSKERQLVYWRSKSLLKKFLIFGSETVHEFVVATQ